MKRTVINIGKDHALQRESACPSCGTHLSGAFALSQGQPSPDTGPKPGQAMICASCGVILIMTRKMKLRLANARERREIGAMPVTQSYLMAQAKISGKKPS
jgi:hypothetical protein